MENTTTDANELIRRAVDTLVEEKGLSELSEDKLAELKKMLEEQLTMRINAAVLEKLPDDKLDEFEEMTKDENVSQDKLREFIEGTNIDFTEAVKTAIEKFRQAFLETDIKAKKIEVEEA